MANELAKITQNLTKSFPDVSSKLAAIPKVTPEVMMIVYLDEIAGRLAELQDTLAEVTTEGTLRGVALTINDRPQIIPILARHISVRNNGPNSVYVNQNKTKPGSNDAPIRINSSISIDFQTSRPRILYFICDVSETAQVDYFTW